MAVTISYELPATALPSQDPPYPVVATLTIVQTAAGVQFTLDPNEASPGYGGSSFVERVDIAYAGDPLTDADFLQVSGTVGDFEFEANPNNVDAGYAAELYHFTVDFPSSPADRLLPGGSSTWTILGASLADFTGTFATANNKPSPIYSVISWIFFVSSGSAGPLCRAMALVMSPCSLIFPAMNACIAACGLASTIIALAVS